MKSKGHRALLLLLVFPVPPNDWRILIFSSVTPSQHFHVNVHARFGSLTNLTTLHGDQLLVFSLSYSALASANKNAQAFSRLERNSHCLLWMTGRVCTLCQTSNLGDKQHLMLEGLALQRVRVI